VAASVAIDRAASRSVPSASKYRRPGREPYACRIQPSGVRTLIPIPLSSQTSSNGIGRPWYDACRAALIAPVAVEWFADASPKLVTTIASDGHGDGTPSFADRFIENATPIARGRWEAIVDVCGITDSSCRPNTLCRPPAIGSLVAAATPSRMSRRPSFEPHWAARVR
jgi:hypothetical protein